MKECEDLGGKFPRVPWYFSALISGGRREQLIAINGFFLGLLWWWGGVSGRHFHPAILRHSTLRVVSGETGETVEVPHVGLGRWLSG